jgi:hypothetical protein
LIKNIFAKMKLSESRFHRSGVPLNVKKFAKNQKLVIIGGCKISFFKKVGNKKENEEEH